MAEHVERLDQRIDDARGKLAGVGRPGVALHDRELVAAEAGDRVDAAHHTLQAFGDRAQSASPTECPSESLTLLKRSRSRNMTASSSPRCSACSILSWNSTRFGRLVSASWRHVDDLASAWRRSVTSS